MNVLQPWVTNLTLMKQSVLLTGIRGPDGVRKYHPIKALVRAFRRAVLLSAFEGRALDPDEPGGGSFTGPCTHPEGLSGVMRQIVQDHDDIPHHYLMHLIHCAQIIGEEHDDWHGQGYLWQEFYQAMCEAFHMRSESTGSYEKRLSDDQTYWMGSHPTLDGEQVS